MWWRPLRYLFAVLALLGAAASVHAATRPIRFERLGVEQGLSQSGALCMFQDSRGFMWFGTEDGLNRYDGYSFTIYRHDPSAADSLPGDFIWAIDEDAAGDLWIATDGGGVARWDRKRDRFVRYRHGAREGLSSDAVRTILVDRGGLVWIGTRNTGLDRLDPRTGLFTHFRTDPANASSLSDDRVYVLREDRSGLLWVGTNGGLNRFDPATNAFVRFRHDGDDPLSLSEDQVRAVFEDRDGGLWVGTQHAGLNRLARGAAAFEHFRKGPAESLGIADDSVRAIVQDGAGRLWVGTDSGLNLREPGATEFARYVSAPSDSATLSDNTVYSILEDNAGVLWFGTRAGGVNKWNPATWWFGHRAMESGNAAGLSHNNVTALTSDPRGNLWIGTLGGGLDVFDRTTGRFSVHRNDPRKPGTLSDDRVTALHYDRDGTVWVGTFAGGLNRLDASGTSFRVYHNDPANPHSITSDAIMSLFEDKQGVLWVGTYRGGLNRYDRATDSFTRFQNDPGNPKSLSGDVVACFADGPRGMLWIGTEAGVNLFDRASGQFHRLMHQPDDPSSLSSNTVFSLFVDGSGTLWVGTRGGGLDRLESFDIASGRARFRNYSQRNGLPNQVIYGIEPDLSGDLWLSTNNGLARLDPRTGAVQIYTASHGLQGTEFNFGAHHRTADGRLLFGGTHGYNEFSPEDIPTNRHRPPVVLTAVLKANRPIATTPPVPELDRLDLSYRDQVVTFEFAGLDYAAPERNRYAYKLEGFAPDWIDLGSVHRVTYTNLDAGRYVLRVKAANSDGVWNEQGLSLGITVVPPPWRRWWAYGAYGLVVLAAMAAAVRSQRKERAREAEYRRRLELEVKSRTQELAERNSELQHMNEKIRDTSLTDSLTGLRNRRFLFEEVAKDLALIHRNQHVGDGPSLAGDGRIDVKSLIFIMVDLDWFKPINDTYGHAVGDSVLVQVKEILEKACRNSDVIARWGGDEFLVVGRNADLDGVEVVPERIRSMIEGTPFDLGDGQVARLTCSIGFTTDPVLGASPHVLTLEQAVTLADGALYIAKKKAGRNAWVGLLGSPNTTADGISRALRADPDRIIQEGHFEIRASRELSTAPATGTSLLG